jgi:hypothetical protein
MTMPLNAVARLAVFLVWPDLTGLEAGFDEHQQIRKVVPQCYHSVDPRVSSDHLSKRELGLLSGLDEFLVKTVPGRGIDLGSDRADDDCQRCAQDGQRAIDGGQLRTQLAGKDFSLSQQLTSCHAKSPRGYDVSNAIFRTPGVAVSVVAPRPLGHHAGRLLPCAICGAPGLLRLDDPRVMPR